MKSKPRDRANHGLCLPGMWNLENVGIPQAIKTNNSNTKTTTKRTKELQQLEEPPLTTATRHHQLPSCRPHFTYRMSRKNKRIVNCVYWTALDAGLLH